MSETVTLQIGGLENDDILITNNIKISFICNTPSELDSHIDHIKNVFNEGEPVVAYVKTVYAPIDGTITQYQNAKGMYYLFNWENNGWDPIVIGSHTHSNMELLDQLGELDVSELQLNQRKVLAVKKINNVNPDFDNGDYDGVYKYKFEYIDLGEIPSLPEAPATDDSLYLSVDKNGEYKWVNRLLPAQTFGYLSLEVTDENKDPSGKTITISKSILEQNNFTFDVNKGDNLLIFDSGKLLSDIVTTQNDTSLTISINNDNPGEVFDIGEKLVLLVLHDGARAIIEDLDGRYWTKQEALDALTENRLSLEGYPTTNEMHTYAAPKNHRHSQYVSKQELDNGFLDWKYAAFYHAHSEYLTEAEAAKYQKDTLKVKTFKIGDIVIDDPTRRLQLKINNLSKITININQAFSDNDILKIFVGTNSTDYTNGKILIGNAGVAENGIDITSAESYVYEFNKKYDSSDSTFYIYPYFNGMIDQLGHYSGDGDITVYYN